MFGRCSIRQCIAATSIAASVLVADVAKATEPEPPLVPAPELSEIQGSDWMRIAHLSDIQDPDELKQAFIDIILPEIRQVNDAIAADRAELRAILARGEETPKVILLADRVRLADLKDRYRTSDLAELQIRVRRIPEAIALAQAALESGWGTSDLAQRSLAFFGQTDGEGGYRFYPSIRASIESYARNLNTHRAYAEFRAARAAGKLDPWDMVSTLTKYSEIGTRYVKKVRGVMTSMEPHTPGMLIADN